jgi:UPF0716 protein FxsA
VGKLILLFTVVPLLELYLLLFIGSVIGFWPTVAIVLVTGVLGAWLAKSEGLRVLRKWQAAIAEGRVPEEGVLGGLLVLVGGVLLVTPGVLTDVAGLLLLFPPTRRLVAAQLKKSVEKKIRSGAIHVVTMRVGDPIDGRPVAGSVIDVEGEEVEKEPVTALPASETR